MQAWEYSLSMHRWCNGQIVKGLFTLDRRDFGVLRLARGKKLHLIP
jgi:hypothetical protein